MGRLSSAVGAAEGKSVEGETKSGGSTAETSHGEFLSQPET